MLSKRILIVDDEESIRDVLRDFFGGQGFEVFEAADGMSALETARREPVDVVLTDLRMPGSDRLEVLKELGHMLPNVPVLILTGYPSSKTAMEALGMRCYGYLTKPVNLGQLSHIVHQGLFQRRWEQVEVEH